MQKRALEMLKLVGIPSPEKDFIPTHMSFQAV